MAISQKNGEAMMFPVRTPYVPSSKSFRFLFVPRVPSRYCLFDGGSDENDESFCRDQCWKSDRDGGNREHFRAARLTQCRPTGLLDYITTVSAWRGAELERRLHQREVGIL